MPNIASLLKSEITRLARKEVKALTDPIRKSNAQHRHDIAALKRQVAALDRQLTQAPRTRDTRPTPDTDNTPTLRFSAKGLQAHHAKLGLSAGDYGALAGVSAQSIYNWESGKAKPRAAQIAALAAVRGMGKREALARLESAS